MTRLVNVKTNRPSTIYTAMLWTIPQCYNQFSDDLDSCLQFREYVDSNPGTIFFAVVLGVPKNVVICC